MEKKNINEQIKKEFNFLNERVVNIKRKRMAKLFAMGISGALIICGMIYFFLWYNDIHLNEFVNQERERLRVRRNERRMNTEAESQLSYSEETPLPKLSEEEMRDSVAIVSYNRYIDEHEGDAKVITSIQRSGLIINADDGIYVLIHDNDLKQSEIVTVRIKNFNVRGSVKAAYSDFKLALIYVEENNVSESNLEKVRAARISTKKDYSTSVGVIDIGNPVGHELTTKKGTLTLTKNIVSIIDAQIHLISTDIELTERENGFIFDENGSVIGIAYEDVSNHISVLAMSGIANLLNIMIQGRDVPYLGIYGREVTEEVIDTIDSDMSKGIYVSSTEVDSPAYDYGILNGDIIVKVGNKKITNFDEYNDAVLSLNPGEEVDIVVRRKGAGKYKDIEYKIMVGAVPQNR